MSVDRDARALACASSSTLTLPVFQSPASNTGAIYTNPTKSDLKRGKSLLVSLHWLTATSQHVSILDAVAFISDYLGHGPEVHQRAQFGYASTFEWLGGLRLMDNEKRPEMGICLLADGDTCDHYGFSQLSWIYQALQFTATRLDLAVDGCRFTPGALRKLWMSDNVRSAARTNNDALPGRERVRSNRWFTGPTGDTFYMGSRTSTQYARCYNMRGFTRFEMELKKERAAQTMQALCDGASMSATLGAVISQFVAFVDKSDINRSRCKALPFWRRFMARLTSSGAVTRLAGQPARTAERLIQWIEHQVAPSLMVYEVLMGRQANYDDVRRDLRRKGLERAKPRHHALIAQAGGWLSSVNPELYNPLPTLAGRC